MRVAIIGVGNCACSLLQAIEASKDGRWTHTALVEGLKNSELPDLEIVAAFDVDRRKVGLPLNEAAFAFPNVTSEYFALAPSEITVSAGAVLDGADGTLAEVIQVADEARSISVEDVTVELQRTNAEAVIIYLPVGSQEAAEFYAEAALAAGCSLLNCTPAVLGNSDKYRARFSSAGLFILGDDMKSHIGSTTIHQALLKVLQERSITVENTYQLNVGGNNDFLNMRDRNRAGAKKVTKVASLTGMMPADAELGVGPSDHIPFLADHKVGYIRITGKGYLGMPFSIELRLEVEDSPNAAAVAIDGLRTISALRQGQELDLTAIGRTLFKAPGVVARAN